ncbi:T9SS type A sorting domain-containing protein [Hymenobacter gummosus]|uniref:T9SS type A sorting domain-containing protein n=1 Tax=Hymenobacter gummosus TaxID=1776032 RepID=A0A431U4U5_9BACT|nr:serine hydrolase [Hymenobacter gummosus]RTQ50876.1 T9SS type A sorting domain-containing protein [Hymenobacter gummosus]
MTRLLLCCLCLLGLLPAAQAQTPLYFPPAGTTWASTSPQSLGWCQPQLDTLLAYLGRQHTKGFIVLKDGRLVVEQYYGTFTRDSLWYWASAGKSLTGTLVGIARQDGLLSLSDSVSRFLGRGWTAAPPAKERLITVRHLLSMSSGLDDTPPLPCDNESTTAACLLYQVDAGTRWAYHTGAYRKLQPLLAQASGLTLNQYTNQKIGSVIGMGGAWVNDVYYSRTRDMARFGLLMLARGKWNGTPVLRDTAYFRQMTTPSQGLNRSYGYLWWLNGQASHMLPQTQLVFPGAITPTAPPDMIAALGKNDQKIYVVPSQGLVVVRTGQSAGQSHLALSSFDTELWRRLMAAVQCRPTAGAASAPLADFAAFPVPAAEVLTVQLPASPAATLRLTDALGRPVQQQPATPPRQQLMLQGLAAGVYFLQLLDEKGNILATRRVLH